VRRLCNRCREALDYLSHVSRRTREAERRRRLATRTLPLALIAVVAFVAGAAIGAPGSPEKEAADRFTAAWAAHDFKAMYRELNDSSRAQVSRKQCIQAYRDAELVATQRGMVAGNAQDSFSRDGRTVVPVSMLITTVAFGRLEDEIDLPYAEGGIDWDPSLVFPGLRANEKLEADVELAPRAAKRRKKTRRCWRGRATRRKRRSGSAAWSRPSTAASPANQAASCWRCRPRAAARRGRWRKRNRSRERR
jgi:hypothetical protein